MSGEAFHADRPDNAASPIYPNGTVPALMKKIKTNATALPAGEQFRTLLEGGLSTPRATAVQLGFLDAGTSPAEG